MGESMTRFWRVRERIFRGGEEFGGWLLGWRGVPEGGCWRGVEKDIFGEMDVRIIWGGETERERGRLAKGRKRDILLGRGY